MYGPRLAVTTPLVNSNRFACARVSRYSSSPMSMPLRSTVAVAMTVILTRCAPIEGRALAVPGGGLLVGPGGAEHAGLVEGPAGDLEADGKARRAEAARQRDGRHAGQAERRGVGAPREEARRRLPLAGDRRLALGDGRRRPGRRRG